MDKLTTSFQPQARRSSVHRIDWAPSASVGVPCRRSAGTEGIVPQLRRFRLRLPLPLTARRRRRRFKPVGQLGFQAYLGNRAASGGTSQPYGVPATLPTLPSFEVWASEIRRDAAQVALWLPAQLPFATSRLTICILFLPPSQLAGVGISYVKVLSLAPARFCCKSPCKPRLSTAFAI